ncbi:RlpA-like double-psi beta-barrel-protein domain-containing protein-containing protein [Infundibulicybe gibba]|nr:RlpA-like double-psi beta-barrel-protein domain-containing protein-containing protein [Infundibulicybe gibba]
MHFTTPLLFLFSALLLVSGAPAANVGDATFFEPGVGACGVTSTATDNIVAVSTQMFDSFPGATANPNTNPICGKTITATVNGKSVTARVVDRCVGCALNDIDLSPAAFNVLGGDGRIHGVQWRFL